ncbi:MAG TPA: ABC transporter ATP-binding protein [Candidatus Limnocylindria bacterium]|jgi:NitT/TauT family transport system ATP-binding protein
MATAGRDTTALEIEVEDLGVRFASRDGEVVALDGMSLSVAAGSLVVVIGPNGCGKSTLLRVIAGLITPGAGRVSIGGTTPRPGDGRAGIAFQQPRLVPWRSVADNVSLPLELDGVAADERRRRAAVSLERVGLGDVGHLRPRELSGGMAQRAGLARALIGDPPVLLLDEPFSALDALTRETFDAELERLWRDRSRTIVLVTHSVSEAVMLADRVIVMTPRPGRVQRVVDVPLARPRQADPAGDAIAAACSEEIRRALADAHADELRPWVERKDAA